MVSTFDTVSDETYTVGDVVFSRLYSLQDLIKYRTKVGSDGELRDQGLYLRVEDVK